MPDARIGVLVAHGMGHQEAGFADPLIGEVSRRLDHLASRVVWQPIHWAAVLEEREAVLWKAMHEARTPDGRAIGLDWTAVRRFVVHNLGDAVGYQRDGHSTSAGRLVHEVISRNVEALQRKLDDPAAPVVVLAHSLGAHMLSNYIWDRQHPHASRPALAAIPTLTSFVTFGCNIPLFALAYDEAHPITLPGEGVTKRELRDAARWLNFLDRDDVLGWPVAPLYLKDWDRLTAGERATVERTEDLEIAVGGPLTDWNPQAHDRYWTDDDFTAPVAAHLTGLLDAFDA
jgi:hypothetical protein